MILDNRINKRHIKNHTPIPALPFSRGLDRITSFAFWPFPFPPSKGCLCFRKLIWSSFPVACIFCFPLSALSAFPPVHWVWVQTDHSPCFSSCIPYTFFTFTSSTPPLFWEATRISYFNFHFALSFHSSTPPAPWGFGWFILTSCSRVVGLLPEKVPFLLCFFVGLKPY